MFGMICIGVAVKQIQREFNLMETKIGFNGKILIGVPYQGRCFPIVENIRDYLISNNIVRKEDVIGNYMFVQQ